LLDLKTKVGVGSLLMIIFGGGFYYWRLESSLNKTPEMKLFEEDQAQFPLFYRHEFYGISMTYPPSWKLSSSQQKSPIIAQFIPQKTDSFLIIPEVKIEVKPSKVNSLDQYTTNSVYQITQVPQAKIIDSRPVKLAGKNGHKVIFTTVDPDNGIEQKYLQAWVLQEDLAYIITYQATIDDYPNFAEAVEQDMLQSIHINLNSKSKVRNSN
jgi:eukaryotic-like serine/threonine-protein kinase